MLDIEWHGRLFYCCLQSRQRATKWVEVKACELPTRNTYPGRPNVVKNSEVTRTYWARLCQFVGGRFTPSREGAGNRLPAKVYI